MYELKLYIVGRTGRSKKAVEDLTAVLEADLRGQYFLKIIDIMENPQLAEKDKILATPTVVKTCPPPVRKIIGDLGQRETVLTVLDLLKEG